MKKSAGEGDIHYRAKVKLLDLLVKGKITLIDNQNRVYKFPKSTAFHYEKEWDINSSNSKVTFIPDISIIDDSNPIWIEVLSEHQCTMAKVNLCKLNRIKVLEFNAQDILNIDDPCDVKLRGICPTEMKYSDYKEIAKGIKNKNTKIKNQLKRKSKASAKTKSEFLDYMDANFLNFMQLMRKQVEEKSFCFKERVDEYLLKRVSNDEVKAVFEKFIDYFYRKHGFSIIRPKFYKKEMLLEINITHFDESPLIVLKETITKIYDQKSKTME